MDLLTEEDFRALGYKILAMPDETSMAEDLETWGIEPHGFNKIVKLFVEDALRNIYHKGTAQSVQEECLDCFLGGFQLGFLAAMELEMRRQASA